MARSIAFHHLTALKALTVLSVLAVLVPNHVQGRLHRHGCPSFSCGPLRNVLSPFRQAGDPPWCGFRSYELICSDTNASIRINNATYHVSRISHSSNTGSIFWVVDPVFDLHNRCPLPQWTRPFYEHKYGPRGRHFEVELALDTYRMASFVKCSREVRNNGMYKPVTCLSTNYSFVYVLTSMFSDTVESLEPFCGYLAMTPLGSWGTPGLANASYTDVIEFMRYGFAIQFPAVGSITECLMESLRALGEAKTIKDWILGLFLVDYYFWTCASGVVHLHGDGYLYLRILALLMWIVKFIAVLCRFVLAPLAVFIFLAYKYWKTSITTDAVELFLRMQQINGPTRYAYTDIVAITSHFKDKVGQGGYGSVYKGVLLPGNVNIAVKVLEDNSNCNGEDFISEVATIGQIHHVNVVRLMGFCSDEMRRALVYEYMPEGSLDKYIFSTEKSFSWDKLNEIALGIARGIDYLHQGCEMQILHFDIKPHNILLDSNFVPKVADFGLAKLYPRGDNFVPLSALRGTIGYIAPEMISQSFGVISSKSDVYPNAGPNAANSSQSYNPSWVYDRLSEQEVCEISPVDDMHELEKKLCIVGLWCIQMRSQMPSRPFFCDEGHTHVENSYHLSSGLTTISEEDE